MWIPNVTTSARGVINPPHPTPPQVPLISVVERPTLDQCCCWICSCQVIDQVLWLTYQDFFFFWKGQSKVQTAPRWENIDAWRQFAHARSECVCIKRIGVEEKECVLNACAALIHSICKRKPPRKRLVCLDKAVQVYCMLESHHCHHHDGHCWLIVWRRCTKHKYSLKPIQQWAPVMTPPLCWSEVHAHTHTREFLQRAF